MPKKESKFEDFKGTIQSYLKILSLNYRTIIPGLATILSILSAIVATIVGEDNRVLVIVSVVSSAVTLFGFALDMFRKISKQKRIIIHSYTDNELSLIFDNIKLEGDYKLLSTNDSRLLYSESENRYIKSTDLNVPFNFKHNKTYSIPFEIRQNAIRIFKDYLSRKKHFYDGKKIRLNTDIRQLISQENDAVVQLSKTTYFNSVCTNEIAKQEIRYDDELSYCFDGFLLVKSKVDGNKVSRIYSLAESQCSNHIGVTTLVITSDNFVILTRQGEKNLVGSNKYIATASGSLDLDDRNKCKTFGEIVKNGMNRELCEECNILIGNIIDTKIVGYGRLLERGGKPEFFGVTYVNLTADDFISLASKGKEVDEDYVCDFIKIKNSKQLIVNNVFTSLKNKKEITIQLKYYIDVLLN